MKTNQIKMKKAGGRFLLSLLLVLNCLSFPLEAAELQITPQVYQPEAPADQIQTSESLNPQVSLASQTSTIFLQGDSPLQPASADTIAPDPALTPQNMPSTFDLENRPWIQRVTVAPKEKMTDIQQTDRGAIIFVSTKDESCAGGGFSFDPTGGVNLTGISDLTVALRGDFDTIKFELVDSQDRKDFVYLTGIKTNEEQVWSISTSQFEGLDLAHVRLAYFIVEGQNKTGQIEVNLAPGEGTTISTVIHAAQDLTTADITSLPENIIQSVNFPSLAPISPEGAVSSVGLTDRGIQVQYDTRDAGWAGGGWTFDHFGTQEIETVDLSGYKNLNFGLKGDRSAVKIEFVDAENRKKAFYLDGIQVGEEKIWRIPVSALEGVDMTRLRLIYFIVEGENAAGTIEINHIPVNPPSAPLFPDWVPFVRELGDFETSLGAVRMYHYNQRSNDIVYFLNLQTGDWVSHHLQGTYSLEQMKAVSPDGTKAILANSLNAVYIVSLPGREPSVKVTGLPVPAGQSVSDSTLASAKFLSNSVAELTAQNGAQYRLDLETLEALPYSLLKPALSNSNFAFYDGYSRHCSQHNLHRCGDELVLFNLKTGESQTLARRSDQPLGWNYTSGAYDVSPDGKFVIFESGNRPFYDSYIPRITVKSLVDSNLKAQLPVTHGSSWHQVTYATDGMPVIVQQINYPSGAVFQKTYKINQSTGGLNAEFLSLQMIKKGNTAYFSGDRTLLIQAETYPVYSGLPTEVFVYQVKNLKPVSLLRTITFPVSAYSTVKLNRLYKKNGISYLSVGLDADSYKQTVVLNINTGQELRFEGAAISVTYQTNRAIYTVLTQDGIQKKVTVNLNTLTIL